MSCLHLVRIPVDGPRLMRFAFEQGITQEDETFGYSLHAWLTALFGKLAPKPFRYFPQRGELLAYAGCDATTLLETAQAFASPQAWAVLDTDRVASKPMPERWRAGQRLRLEALVCPVTRKDGEEKDVFLRALDRHARSQQPASDDTGEPEPTRGEVYREWFIRQLGNAVSVRELELSGMSARVRMLRRARNGTNRLRIIERPRALFAAEVSVSDPEAFAALLARGIGRHRAFGFGMVLLAPAR